MINSYIDAWVDFGNMSGRVGVKTYTEFSIVNVLVLVTAAGVDMLLVKIGIPEAAAVLSLIYGICSLMPNISMAVKRLHDIGQPGYFGLFFLIPILGWIYFLYVSMKKGDEERNKYGFPPN